MPLFSAPTRDSATHRSERAQGGASARAGARAQEQPDKLRAQLDIIVPWYTRAMARLVPARYLRLHSDYGVRRFSDRRKKVVPAPEFEVVSVPSKTYGIDHDMVANAMVGYAELVRRMLALPEAIGWPASNRRNLLDLMGMADHYAPMVRSPHDELRIFVVANKNDRVRTRRGPFRYPVIYGVGIIDGARGGGGNPIVIAHPLTQPTTGSDRTRGNVTPRDLVGISTEEHAAALLGEWTQHRGGDLRLFCVPRSSEAGSSSDSPTAIGRMSTDTDWSQSSNPQAALAAAKRGVQFANAMAPLDRDFRLWNIGRTVGMHAYVQLIKEGRLARRLTVEVTNVRSQTIVSKWGATPHAAE
ncbi:MAG TPA: hypothetical protein VL635_12070 [Trinickia sp.]|nr:hypothetical protein [Trinickia sp.]